MANKHIRVITLQEPARTFFQRAADAMRRMGWNVFRVEETFLEGSVSMSIWSWGEDIQMRQVSNDQVELVSKCKLVTQVIDFGRNRKNIDKILAMMDQV